MNNFEFDLAFPVDEVAAGLRRVLAAERWAWAESQCGDRIEFRVAFSASASAVISVDPLALERGALTPFPERSLLSAAALSASPEELAHLRRRLILAFLRAAG